MITTIENIEKNVQRLIAANHELNEKVSQQNETIAALHAIIEEKNTIINNLKQQSYQTTITRDTSVPNGNCEEIKTRIDELVAEIDRCIMLLGSK